MGIINWIAGNKVAMYIIGALLFLVGLQGVKWNERRKGRAQGREQMRQRSRKKTNRVRSKIDEEENRITKRLNNGSLRDIAGSHRDRRNKRNPVR